jgi:hypothetical protein
MKLGMGILFACMLAAGYLLAPAILIWGWFRWAQREHTGGPFFLSFFGFILSTASALLAVFTITYAVVIHSFAYYDPWPAQNFPMGSFDVFVRHYASPYWNWATKCAAMAGTSSWYWHACVLDSCCFR